MYLLSKIVIFIVILVFGGVLPFPPAKTQKGNPQRTYRNDSSVRFLTTRTEGICQGKADSDVSITCVYSRQHRQLWKGKQFKRGHM